MRCCEWLAALKKGRRLADLVAPSQSIPRRCRRREVVTSTERQQQRDPVNVTDAAQLDQIAFGADLVRLQVRDL